MSAARLCAPAAFTGRAAAQVEEYLAEIAEPDAVARFVLNAEHHAVRRLADCGDAELQRVALEALYAHALLAGRHPLTPFDSALVARALPALIDRAVDGGPA